MQDPRAEVVFVRLPRGPDVRPGRKDYLARPHNDDLASLPKMTRHILNAVAERLVKPRGRRRPGSADRVQAPGGWKLR